MRKYFTISVLFVISQIAFGQDVDKLFSSFASEKGAELIDMADTNMKMENKISVKINSGKTKIEVLNLDNCSAGVKEKFANQIDKIKDGKYNVLVKSKSDGNNMQILKKENNDENGEVFVINAGKNNVMIKVSGDLKGLGLENLMGKN